MSETPAKPPARSSKPPAPRGRFAGLSAEERRKRRRQLLIEAGLQCFGTEGFHATGIRQVCAAAQLSERYFYESFEGLRPLFEAVYGQVVVRIRSELEAVVREHAGVAEQGELVRAVLRAYLALFRADPRLVRVGLIEVNSVGAEMGSRALSVNRSFTDLIVPSIEAACPDIDSLGFDAQLVAEGLLGSTLFLVTQWATDGFRTPLPTMIEHCALPYDALLHTLHNDGDGPA